MSPAGQRSARLQVRFPSSSLPQHVEPKRRRLEPQKRLPTPSKQVQLGPSVQSLRVPRRWFHTFQNSVDPIKSSGSLPRSCSCPFVDRVVPDFPAA
eukprot:CAMPEP_0118982608 /NCGR_PEP_ID=MMETSP1173-20130426/33211_1 /TAXON_ID=1034831 /ORGANISM="Rhizochromulina marina cf, Strain CCMP1243" /LENGTH=95 /DNA_ID=CAMNT_0006933113 /DNA_START=678 /DNA_END=962 /DNA_ORIENTATION=+